MQNLIFELFFVLSALFFEKFHRQARLFETFYSVCERFCFMCNHLSFFSVDASSIGLFRLFPVRRSSDSQLTPWRGSSKGQSRPRGSSKKRSTRFCTPMNHFSFRHSREKYRETRTSMSIDRATTTHTFRLQHYRETSLLSFLDTGDSFVFHLLSSAA